MGTFWSRHARIGFVGLGALLASAGVGTVGVGAQTNAAQEDPLELFSELMPVFSSPRCVNCHGGTNPATALNHVGGRQDVPLDRPGGDMSLETGQNAECLTCHTSPAAESGGWRLAPKHTSFVGKDTLALCRQFRTDPFSFNLHFAEGRAAFVSHVATDELIGVGFEGNGGVDADSAFFADVTVEPPPMSRAEFVSKTQRWMTDGLGACSNKWNGTITETTTASEKVTFAPAPGGRAVSTDTHTTVTVVENEATTEVHWESTDFIDVPTRECAVYVHHTFTAVDYRLPTDVTIVLNPPTLPPGMVPGQLPPGFELPPGMELPPGFEFPSLPPELTLPADLFGPFIIYATGSDAVVTGNHHSDLRSLPGCVQAVRDEQHPYHAGGGRIELKATPGDPPTYGDPENPNHLIGEKVTDSANGKTTIKWDLIRDQE